MPYRMQCTSIKTPTRQRSKTPSLREVLQWVIVSDRKKKKTEPRRQTWFETGWKTQTTKNKFLIPQMKHVHAKTWWYLSWRLHHFAIADPSKIVPPLPSCFRKFSKRGWPWETGRSRQFIQCCVLVQESLWFKRAIVAICQCSFP